MTFLVMAGIGFDAALIDAADDDKERLGMVAYLRAGAKEVRDRKPFPVKVELDGDEVFDGDASCVLVANIGTLKGFEAFPDAVPTDGTLDAAVVTASGVREWAGLMVERDPPPPAAVRSRRSPRRQDDHGPHAEEAPLRAGRRCQRRGQEARVRSRAELADRLRSGGNRGRCGRLLAAGGSPLTCECVNIVRG